MNATDFIKQHCVDKAREVVEGAPETATHFLYDAELDSADYLKHVPCVSEFSFDLWDAGGWKPFLRTKKRIDLSDLKRVVESVELVEQFGNELAGAKQLLEFSKDCKTIELSGSVITVERLKQAISDYESIGGEHV